MAFTRLDQEERRHLDRALWPMVLLAGVGARAAFLISHPHLWSSELAWWKLSEGGMTSYGGLLGALTGLALYRRLHALPLLPFLDRVAFALLAGWGVGRIGCFLTWYGEEGKPCRWPWAVHTPEGPFHPVQLYLITLLWLGAILFRWRRAETPGRVAAEALIWYAAARAFSDLFRAYNPPHLEQLSQSFCLLLAASGIASVLILHSASLPEDGECKLNA